MTNFPLPARIARTREPKVAELLLAASGFPIPSTALLPNCSWCRAILFSMKWERKESSANSHFQDAKIRRRRPTSRMIHPGQMA